MKVSTETTHTGAPQHSPANAAPQQAGIENEGLEFEDKREELIHQMSLQALIDQSPRVVAQRQRLDRLFGTPRHASQRAVVQGVFKIYHFTSGEEADIPAPIGVTEELDEATTATSTSTSTTVPEDTEEAESSSHAATTTSSATLPSIGRIETQTIPDWPSLVEAMPELEDKMPLDARVFSSMAHVRQVGKHSYVLVIPAPHHWTYNEIQASEVYDKLKRWASLVFPLVKSETQKSVVHLMEGVQQFGPNGIGLQVTHEVWNPALRQLRERSKVMEVIHKVEDSTTYNLPVDLIDTFTDFHHIKHIAPGPDDFTGTKTIHQLWLDHDNRDIVIPQSGFEIVKTISRLEDGTYKVSITKSPKAITIRAYSALAGGGSEVSVTFKMRWGREQGFFQFVS